MKYKSIPPIKINYCNGCAFYHGHLSCNRPSSVTYPCCASGRHNNIWILKSLILNPNIHVL